MKTIKVKFGRDTKFHPTFTYLGRRKETWWQKAIGFVMRLFACAAILTGFWAILVAVFACF